MRALSEPVAVFIFSSSSASTALSMRLTKKLATLATRSTGRPLLTRASMASTNARATSSYASFAKSRVTLTLIPSVSSVRMAGTPSGVAGTLIMTLGRLTSFQRRRASSRVPCVLFARSGATSRLT